MYLIVHVFRWFSFQHPFVAKCKPKRLLVSLIEEAKAVQTKSRAVEDAKDSSEEEEPVFIHFMLNAFQYFALPVLFFC